MTYRNWFEHRHAKVPAPVPQSPVNEDFVTAAKYIGAYKESATVRATADDIIKRNKETMLKLLRQVQDWKAFNDSIDKILEKDASPHLRGLKTVRENGTGQGLLRI